MSVLDDALGVLLSDELAHVVDLALCARDGIIEAHARCGSVGFSKGEVRWVRGANPLERQDPAAFAPLSSELRELRPDNARNHYPFAYDNVEHLFADDRAPDIAVVHTPAHNWEERGGHRGEHGSLDVVQSRAPLIVSGAGVKQLGIADRVARMVNVGPTIAALAGARVAHAEGEPLDDLIDAAPGRVVAFLWDGTNANVLYEMAASGELPTVARLMDAGTTFRHGCIASFPSVTLANHTTGATGCHPGTHGVLNNFYFDRVTGRQIVANSPETWHEARDKISTRVQTVFEAVDGFTAAINEPADRGASYATFDLVRAAGGWAALQASVPAPADVPGSTTSFMSIPEYGWSSSADHLAVQQATQVWTQHPALMWVNLILPDAANHAGGPHSEVGYAGLRDTDARMGEIVDGIGWGDDRTACVLFADHGMEQSDPACKGDWDVALGQARISFRDEGYGFIYLEP
ncbi:MAG: alkaline phosphatase family protein [Actinomycetota bacterium]